MMRASAALPLLLLFAACSDGQSRSTPPPASDTPDLEQAAIASGAIPDISRIDPAGLFERRHEGGTDALCLVPDGEGEYRFSAVADAGAAAHCAGQGRARRAGDVLVLRFDRPSRCFIVVQYEGDRIMFPGAVDMDCDKLCSDRSSFAGVAVPRLSGSERAARSSAGKDGRPLCPGGAG